MKHIAVFVSALTVTLVATATAAGASLRPGYRVLAPGYRVLDPGYRYLAPIHHAAGLPVLGIAIAAAVVFVGVAVVAFRAVRHA